MLYVVGVGGPQLIGLDPRTGRTVWHLNASPSAVTPGVVPQLGVFGDHVVALKRIDPASQTAQLVSVAAASGTIAWAAPPALFTGWPIPCVDEPADVCVTSTSAAGNGTTLLRYVAATGRPLAPVVVSSAQAGRDLAPDLFDPGDRSPEVLLATSGGSVSWHRPLSGAFPRAGYSTDNGWNFDRVPAVGLFVGSVQGPPVSSSAGQGAFDLSRTASAGVRISDGSVVWRDQGSQYLCSLLPCPGMTQGSSGADVYRPPTLGLRYRATGTITAGAAGAMSASPGLNMVLEGFNLGAGRTVWSFDAGADTALAEGTPPPQAGPETVVVPATNGTLMLLDLTTGAATPAPGLTIAWCSTSTTYPVSPPYDNGDGTTTTSYQGAYATFPCGVTARPTNIPAHAPAYAGPALDGVVAWSDAHRVVAAPTGG